MFVSSFLAFVVNFFSGELLKHIKTEIENSLGMAPVQSERDEGIGLCTGPLPVYFCGHYSFGPCVN